ncbi:hypothetical protein MIN45_P2219 [Methylomarinovum tepidoasis]|uniref:Uncharacterized protein n=1 Tax=Methylomarinovum tepidoasis TaxID=2840183 RepID=A0AAU9CD51_9GAMM|nr:hypothetical protein [Methylomarinovum sp. IN45]BCX89846.1 hypothetical protein MIN45_P2219 [Methylomarinovum sp. IN45]
MKDLRDCAFCRMMRALAFSGLGAAVGGYGALYLGASRENALMAAVAGAVMLVLGMNLRERRRR